jgi:hypothetical protein
MSDPVYYRIDWRWIGNNLWLPYCRWNTLDEAIKGFPKYPELNEEFRIVKVIEEEIKYEPETP